MTCAFDRMAQACGLLPLSAVEQREYDAFLDHVRDNVVPTIARDVYAREKYWAEAKRLIIFVR
ncbi:hypothetical protein A9R05_42910 (plasmid) [Burkholderia sp. KK1]|uniref:hypothetical protein n=1 Tax=Burkholderia sp. M701 TaxID=326454 RepID=UPI000979A481|nr:hypothetical protein [Burkholderia sp. M701]AQH05771.1 hypothetical protein A9R05_42910 [Burkholderia sp. KK1]